MLCESIAYLLIEQGIVTKEQMIGAIEGIITIKQEIAGTSESVVVSVASILLLQSILQSVSAASRP